MSLAVLIARLVGVGGGLLLAGFGLWRLLSQRHFRWVGMRLSLWQLGCWSFLMSSAHGAGLMLMPVLTGSYAPAHEHGLTHAGGEAVTAAIFVTGVHTLAMFVVAGVVAVVV